MKIIFDSGVRTGSDVFKAIALGAHAVEVGRLYIWGMAHEGEAGCRHVMKSLLAVSCIILSPLSLDGLTYFPLQITGSRYHDDCRRIRVDYA
jgi:hypothetical protein